MPSQGLNTTLQLRTIFLILWIENCKFDVLFLAKNLTYVDFHRAFDQCRDTVEAYGDLEGLGVRYVLTSGAAQTAADGASVIAGLVASGGPIVVAAGAVRPNGLVDLVESTGVREVHMRCPREGLSPDEPQRTDEALVRRAVEAVRAVPLPE